MRHRHTLILALALVGCDAELDDLEPDPVELAEDGGPTRLGATETAPTRLPGLPPADPCEATAAPVMRLTNGTDWPGEVVAFDSCMHAVPGLDGCDVSDYEYSLGDLTFPTDEVLLGCTFVCTGGPQRVELVAGFPPLGAEVEVAFAHPCPGEVAP